MREFKYKAIGGNGALTFGSIDAIDKRDALRKIEKLGLKPVSVKGSENEISGEEQSYGSLKKGGGERVALKLIKKLQQLCGNGGMPVSAALKALSQRALEKSVKNISRELYKDLTEGKTLADSIAKYPDTFDSCTIHLVEAGESTANLGFVFQNIIEYIDWIKRV